MNSFVLSLALASMACAQSVSGGSTGTDGALVLTKPGVTLFEKRAFKRTVKAGDDNTFRFSSVHVGREVTLKLSANVLSGPVFWLVEGPVQIEGTIDLSGEDGSHVLSMPGAGGFPGGGIQKPGYGPANFKRNEFLIPLIGGDGGSGGDTRGGGAGGGALLIASSTSITIDGIIRADGGTSLDGTGGGGGAVRLVAPVIEGSGQLSARGGAPNGLGGRIRMEAVQNFFAGSLNDTPLFRGKPLGLFLPPSPTPSVRIVSIDGAPYMGGDLRSNRSLPVRLIIESNNVPPGTSVELEFFSEDGQVQTIHTGPLEGDFAVSHAVATVKLPNGWLRAYVRATWAPEIPKPQESRR